MIPHDQEMVARWCRNVQQRRTELKRLAWKRTHYEYHAEVDNATPNQGGQVDVEESVVVEGARKRKLVRQPRSPTQAELKQHILWHLSFRELCVVEGATGIQCRSSQEPDGAIGVIVSMDCQTVMSGQPQSYLITGYEQCGCAQLTEKVRVHGVGKWIIEKFDEAGCCGKDITLKSDGELALRHVKRSAMAARIGIKTLLQGQSGRSKAISGH